MDGDLKSVRKNQSFFQAKSLWLRLLISVNVGKKKNSYDESYKISLIGAY